MRMSEEQIEKEAEAYTVEKFYSFIDAREQVVEAFKAGYKLADSEARREEVVKMKAWFLANAKQYWPHGMLTRGDIEHLFNLYQKEELPPPPKQAEAAK